MTSVNSVEAKIQDKSHEDKPSSHTEKVSCEEPKAEFNPQPWFEYVVGEFTD